jgi:plasmid stabilization system protein ParE
VDEIRFHPEAEDEYQSALAWYRARSPQASGRFEAEVDRVLKSIATTPGMYPKYDENHRFATLGRFPYSIVYRESPGRIDVIAVAHSKRSASYWEGRA